MTNDNKKWVCTVCGYVYDGEIPFEELPEDYLCPLCGVGKEFFELQQALNLSEKPPFQAALLITFQFQFPILQELVS